jgi:glycine/D-amino acid oxidase-like deaminating enzyme
MKVDMGNALDKRVVVISAGIVGASLAYHLADKGANITLVEAEGIQRCGSCSDGAVPNE